jgi:hypothetical protein
MLPGLDTKATTRSPRQDHGDTPGIQARQNYLTGSPPQFSDTHLACSLTCSAELWAFADLALGDLGVSLQMSAASA